MLSAGQSVTGDSVLMKDDNPKPLPELFDDSRAFLADLVSFVLENAGLYRSGQDKRAKESFVQTVEGLEFMMMIINHISALCRLDPGSLSFAGGSGADKINELNKILMEMIGSQERNDWVLLADLMEYELVPQIQGWNEIFSQMERCTKDKAL